MTKVITIPHSRPWITAGDEAAVMTKLSSGEIGDGATVENFEKLLAKVSGLAGVHFLSSGTAALHVALDAMNFSLGDEVILPTYVCKHVSDAVIAAGGIPVLCDIGQNWTMTPETVSGKISKRTRAIILVGILGIVEPIRPFREFGLPIISDFAQCFDEIILNGNPRIDVGDIVVCSFHAIKCMTTGNGGMVGATNVKWQTALQISALKFLSRYVGSDIGAALGLAQLARYEMFRRRRRELSNFYFSSLPANLTEKLGEVRHRWHAYRFPLSQSAIDFEIFARRLWENGVTARRGVDSLLHKRAGMTDSEFPNALQSFQRTVSIPMYPSLTDQEAERVVRACNRCWNQG